MIHTAPTYKPQSTFNPAHQALLNQITTNPEHTRLARQRITRDAPDLLHMIFGAA
jgi:hypothetical protein